MIDSFFKEWFINGLKEMIREQVLMDHCATWLEASQKYREVKIMVDAQTKRPPFIPQP
jgi:hypothetical protein